MTGGSGKLGRAVVAELVEHGYDVVNLDRVAPPGSRGRFVRVDLTDFGQVVEALTGVDGHGDAIDAVVHLGAIPAPGLTTNASTFTHNVTASYHVFQAARIAGIRSWIALKVPLAEQVTMAAVSTSEPSAPIQGCHRPASAIGAPSARRTANGVLTAALPLPSRRHS